MPVQRKSRTPSCPDRSEASEVSLRAVTHTAPAQPHTPPPPATGEPAPQGTDIPSHTVPGEGVTPASTDATEWSAQPRQHHRPSLESEVGPNAAPEGVTEVFAPTFNVIYDVPSSCVVHLPPARLNITRLVLCRNYRAHEPWSCGMGHNCKFVHADCDYASLEAHPIHVNYIWRDESCCTYPRLAVRREALGLRTDFNVCLNAGDACGAVEVVPASRLLYTEACAALLGADVGGWSAAPLEHCPHFANDRMCRLGEACPLAHVLYVDPSVRGEFKRPPSRQLSTTGSAATTAAAAHGGSAMGMRHGASLTASPASVGLAGERSVRSGRSPISSSPLSVAAAVGGGGCSPPRRSSGGAYGSKSSCDGSPLSPSLPYILPTGVTVGSGRAFGSARSGSLSAPSVGVGASLHRATSCVSARSNPSSFAAGPAPATALSTPAAFQLYPRSHPAPAALSENAQLLQPPQVRLQLPQRQLQPQPQPPVPMSGAGPLTANATATPPAGYSQTAPQVTVSPATRALPRGDDTHLSATTTSIPRRCASATLVSQRRPLVQPRRAALVTDPHLPTATLSTAAGDGGAMSLTAAAASAATFPRGERTASPVSTTRVPPTEGVGAPYTGAGEAGAHRGPAPYPYRWAGVASGGFSGGPAMAQPPVSHAGEGGIVNVLIRHSHRSPYAAPLQAYGIAGSSTDRALFSLNASACEGDDGAAGRGARYADGSYTTMPSAAASATNIVPSTQYRHCPYRLNLLDSSTPSSGPGPAHAAAGPASSSGQSAAGAKKVTVIRYRNDPYAAAARILVGPTEH